MRTLGICFGATTLQTVELFRDERGIRTGRTTRKLHDGNPKRAFLEFLRSHADLAAIDRIAVTGRAFRKCVALSSIAEPEAVEMALKSSYREDDRPDLIISSGGETQLIYVI